MDRFLLDQDPFFGITDTLYSRLRMTLPAFFQCRSVGTILILNLVKIIICFSVLHKFRKLRILEQQNRHRDPQYEEDTPTKPEQDFNGKHFRLTTILRTSLFDSKTLTASNQVGIQYVKIIPSIWVCDAFWLIWFINQRALYHHALSVVSPASSLVLASSVHTSLSHRIRHRNFIFGTNMPLCSQYMHMKYLVILMSIVFCDSSDPPPDVESHT